MAGNPEDATYKGKPLWMDYLPEVDAVLKAALPDDWERIRGMDEGRF